LVELVVVVLVMSIFAAVAVPTFVDSLLFHRVESAARRFKADLELVRHTARLTSSTQTLTVVGLTYSASTGVADFDHPGETYVLDLTKPPHKLDTLTANFGGLPSISYDGYGKPSSGGTVILQAKGCGCTLTLDAVTGEITITSNHTRSRTAAAN
jgi:Tfp pilus assembly protein FimT